MKNQLLKLRKAEGFISIETIMVAAIMVLAGLIAYNIMYAGTLADNGRILTDEPPMRRFNMIMTPAQTLILKKNSI